MPEQEKWRPVAGFPDYMVSDRGRVLSNVGSKPRVLVGSMATNGYRKVLLTRDRQSFNRSVHTLVAEAFHGPRPEGLVCRHLDGDRLNNASSNLTWGTYSENAQDRVRHGNDAFARRTACIHGHRYTEGNTYITPEGARRCRTCHNKRDAASKIRRGLRAASVRMVEAA
jgi:hypothetical protein